MPICAPIAFLRVERATLAILRNHTSLVSFLQHNASFYTIITIKPLLHSKLTLFLEYHEFDFLIK